MTRRPRSLAPRMPAPRGGPAARASSPDALRRSGFTLIEILVAVAVLALLIGLAIPALNASRRRGQVHACQATIERLKLAVERYAAAFGDFPPSSLGELGIPRTNGVNEGIESLLRALTTAGRGGPFLEPSAEELANTDGDAIAATADDPTGSVLGSRELLELVDPWGNPFIYFHHRDYRGGRGIEDYAIGGRQQRCRPRPEETTGSYPALTSFMIWSAGPNGLNEDGGGDDVTSW
ncbi:MAG: hypothetical protein KatS3mg102_0570 [Planctomycetota bacterium]|nr:MAG: hypothetical protein KatS3mg102_0570 [Planctomycetota bacterium]